MYKLTLLAILVAMTGCATTGPSNADINLLNGKVEMLSAEVRQQHDRVVVLERDNHHLSQQVAGHTQAIQVGAVMLGAIVMHEMGPAPTIHQPATLGD